ncbi:hypothetical protein BBK36DRAFT_1173277 [Trichoderma citrinoviride]|uniref:Uncharacterized protein n=1 Tax=Trichoderma citrinoviride TaxID=58853 RepID=A0A2T4AX57_9HYPO|nr:hypothetical protein BBK36DRAFT_1173277 [Trichoderma citrinoviride]PTB61629.1 hypothetical protein BBK36DRAFT_1173277 [Trichoderma citrinoviride]
MQLTELPPKSSRMAQVPHQGGLHYIELIKTNLQFIHGKDCLFQILSQVKALDDHWQVSVLKTDETGSSSPRSIVLFDDSGPGLVAALAKLHRRSAEMLAAFLADNAGDASAYMRRKEAEALSKKTTDEQPKKKKKKEVERSRNGVEKPQSDDDDDEVKTPTAVQVAVVAKAVGGLSADGQRPLRMSARSPPPPLEEKKKKKKNGWERVAAPCRFRGWRSPSPPPCEEDYEPVSRYEDSSLRPRGIICPNYGPASAFYRVPDVRTELAYWPSARVAKAPEDNKVEVGKPAAGDSACPPAPAAASSATAAALTAEAIKTLAPQPPHKTESDKENMESTLPAVSTQAEEDVAQIKRIDKKSVLLYISWPSYGSTIVADQCELSVRSLQSRVRHMLRSNGPALFGDALLGAEPPVVFGPDEVPSFVVQIKGLRDDEVL